MLPPSGQQTSLLAPFGLGASRRPPPGTLKQPRKNAGVRPPTPKQPRKHAGFRPLAPQTQLPNGPIWVPRPLDKCTGGEKGLKNRSPLLPRPKNAEKKNKWHPNGLIGVPRPLDRCTGGEKRSKESIPPAPEAAKRQKRPITAKQNFTSPGGLAAGALAPLDNYR